MKREDIKKSQRGKETNKRMKEEKEKTLKEHK